MSSQTRIAVYGATGTTGTLVARALLAQGVDVVAVGRDAVKLEAFGGRVEVAAATDPRALERAFRGVQVVVACAGPFAEIGEPVLEAAIAAGAHYLDVSGEQRFVRAMYEQHEAAARRAGVCAIPGMAVEAAPGDLAARWAAEHLLDAEPDEPAVRDTGCELLAEDDPLDEIAVAYVYDRFTPTPTTQRSSLGVAAAPGVIWRNDRWDPVAPAAERRRVNAGRAGERDVVSFPSGEVITVPRHVAVRRVQSFVALSRSGWVSRAASLLSPALPLVARAMPARWVPDAPVDAATRARAELTIVVTARRGFDDAQITISGRDVYATTAAIAAWAAHALARRTRGPTGVLAPSEAFGARATLTALAAVAGITVATSFGVRIP